MSLCSSGGAEKPSIVRAPVGCGGAAGSAGGAAGGASALKSMAGMAIVSPSPGPGDWSPGAGAGEVVALGIVGGAPALAVGGASDATGNVMPRGGLGAPTTGVTPPGAGGLAPHWLQNRAPSGSG